MDTLLEIFFVLGIVAAVVGNFLFNIILFCEVIMGDEKERRNLCLLGFLLFLLNVILVTTGFYKLHTLIGV